MSRAGQGWSIRRLVLAGLLVALSAVGALAKLPGPVGSIALDSWPGFFAAMALSPGMGALVAGCGHLASAATAGVPLSPLVHLVIAAEMAACAAAAGWARRRVGLPAAAITAVFLNGVAAPAVLAPVLGGGFFAAVVIPLSVAAACNVMAAAAAYAAWVRAGAGVSRSGTAVR